jgi:hypothetical protein
MNFADPLQECDQLRSRRSRSRAMHAETEEEYLIVFKNEEIIFLEIFSTRKTGYLK